MLGSGGGLSTIDGEVESGWVVVEDDEAVDGGAGGNCRRLGASRSDEI